MHHMPGVLPMIIHGTILLLLQEVLLHYDLFKNEKVDTYGGVAVGLRMQSYSYYTWVPPYGVNDYEKVSTTYSSPSGCIICWWALLFHE